MEVPRAGMLSADPEPATDQRRHRRVLTPSVRCTLGDVVDISAAGMRVRCPGKATCAIGQRVMVTIESDTTRFEVALRPVWTREIEPGYADIGACFEDVDESTRVKLLGLVRAVVANMRLDRD